MLHHRAYTPNFCFHFTGKEKDPETGYSYFGARYLEHELMTCWLSVDPMADKYPSISPYAYCAWNPVKLVDPDGMDTIVSINIGNGHVNMESSDLHIKGCVVTFYDDGSDVPLEEYYCKGQIHTASFANSNSDLIYFSDDSDAEKTYNYLAGKDGSWFASDVEWNYYKNMYGAESQLLTSHKRDEIDVTQFTSLGELTVQFRHFHPYYADMDYSIPSDKDIIYARMINIPCYLDYCGKSYRFDNVVPERIKEPPSETIRYFVQTKILNYESFCN